jgi:hypothetical protein
MRQKPSTLVWRSRRGSIRGFAPFVLRAAALDHRRVELAVAHCTR